MNARRERIERDAENEAAELGRMESLLRSLSVIEASADCMMVTATMAAMLPVLQLMMSSASTSGALFRSALATANNVETASLPILTEAVGKLLRSPANVVYEKSTSFEPSPQPQPLAVT